MIEFSNEKTNDIDLLWEENLMLKNALKTLEASITSESTSSPDYTNTEVLSKVFENTIKEKIEEVEKRLDAKIILFQEELENLFQAKIKSIDQSFSDRLANLSEKLIKLKTHTSKTKQMAPSTLFNLSAVHLTKK